MNACPRSRFGWSISAGFASARSGMRRAHAPPPGITTLTKRHVEVRGSRIVFRFRGKHKVWMTQLADAELAAAMRDLLALPGGRRLFQVRVERGLLQPDGGAAERLRAGVPGRGIHCQGFPHVGWHADRGDQARRARNPGVRGGSQAIWRRRHAPRRRATRKHAGGGAGVLREPRGGRAVPRRADDRGFFDRAIRVVGARDIGLDPEEQALLSLLRSWRIRRSREAA